MAHFNRDGNVKRLRGSQLMKRNARFLRQHPLCVECERLGLVGAAEEVDHRTPLAKGGRDHESNLQGLCRRHHKEKTARDFDLHTWPEVGADGWPKASGGAR